MFNSLSYQRKKRELAHEKLWHIGTVTYGTFDLNCLRNLPYKEMGENKILTQVTFE